MTISDLTDLSSPQPVVKWSEAWWENAKPEVRAHRCKAHGKKRRQMQTSRNRRCKRVPPTRWTRTAGPCKSSAPLGRSNRHDGRALLKMATDDNVADSVKLTAIRDALDRGGVVAKTAVDVEVSAKPFMAILDNLEAGSRAEYRRSIGREDADEPQQTLSLPPSDFGDDDLI